MMNLIDQNLAFFKKIQDLSFDVNSLFEFFFFEMLKANILIIS